MSCKRVLCLLGPSYPTRLWCIWELFTLIAFGSAELAAQRIIMRPLESGDGSGMDVLCDFDVRNARCYDPNEQARLMAVIEAVGVDLFNSRVCKLGVRLKEDGSKSSLLQKLSAYRPRSALRKSDPQQDSHQAIVLDVGGDAGESDAVDVVCDIDEDHVACALFTTMATV